MARLFWIVVVVFLAVVTVGRVNGQDDGFEWVKEDQERDFASFSANVTLYIDPVNGVDAEGCGINAGEPNGTCASLSGAIFYNNITTSNTDLTYQFLLANGTYTGAANQNITVPQNLISIASASGVPDSVVFEGTTYNQGVNLTTLGSVFTIQYSFQLSSVSFSGVFAFDPNSSDYPTAYISPINITVTTSQKTSILLFNLKVAKTTQFASLISAQIPSTASLSVENIDVHFPPTPLLEIYDLFIISVVSNDPPALRCSSNYTWPRFTLNNFNIYKDKGNSTNPLNSYPGAVTTSDVTFLLSNLTWTSIPSSQLISSLSTCLFSFMNPPVDTRPSVSLNTVTVKDSLFVGSAILISGNQVSLAGINLSNLSPNNENEAWQAVFITSVTLSITDSTFQNFQGRNNEGYNYILLALYWAMSLNCPSGVPLSNCMWKTLPVKSKIQRVSFLNNNILPLYMEFDTNSVFNPPLPFESKFVTVTIDSSQFIGNNGTGNTDFFGGAIYAASEMYRWTSSGAWVTSNATYQTELVITNSLFQNNIAFQSGGALALSDVSANISNTVFSGNSVYFPPYEQPWQACNFRGQDVYGGGAIYASGYSLVKLSQNVSFVNNMVPSSTARSTPYIMSGAILCCSSAAYTNITITSDGTTTFNNNSAPLIADMSCFNSSWHESLPTCNFQGQALESNYCEFGHKRTPGWFIFLMVFFALLIVGGAGGFYAWKKRKAAVEYQPLL